MAHQRRTATARDEGDQPTYEHETDETNENAINRTTSGDEARHHASAQGGVNDWMNRMAFALAKRHGIATLDMTPLTVAQTSSDAWSRRWGDELAAGRVDLHHWYAGLWKPVMTGLLKLCDEHCGWLPPHRASVDCG